MMNEYKQEIDLQLNLLYLKYENIYEIEFITYSSFYNVIIILICLHGICDIIIVRFLKLIEYCILFYDIVLMTSLDILFMYITIFN